MKKPKVFQLPSIRLGKNALVARMSQTTVQAKDSDERVLAETPSLRKLKAILERRVP